MANIDAPFGAKVIGGKSGTYNAQLTAMFIPASDTDVFGVGDVVVLGGSADARGVPTIAKYAATGTPVGIIASFEHNPDNLSEVHRPTLQARYVLVDTNPDIEFIIQDDSVGGALTAASYGLNAEILPGTVNPVTGLSGMEIDASSAATTSTLPLNINSLYNVEDNEIGNFAIHVCSFNVHQYKSVGVAGA